MLSGDARTGADTAVWEEAMATVETNSAAGKEPGGDQAASAFVTGGVPRRRWLVIGVGAMAGFLLTVVWSAQFVDRTIGDTVANTLLGHDAKETPVTGIGAGVLFAFVSGLACTFTACNVAAFSAVAPLLGDSSSRLARFGHTLKPLGWMCAGMIAVAAAYGALVGLVGTRMPQFDTAQSVAGTVSARGVQSMVVFGVIGLAMLYLGLAAAGVVRDPLARVARRWPNAPMVIVGMLVGGLLVGRPFALFRSMFRDAAEQHNAFYGAVVFVLQSLGNVVALAILFLILTYLTRGRVRRWLTADPSRLAAITAAGFVAAGTFTVLYWDVRLLAMREILPWYPLAPWV
jgi:hypothetical protein